MNLKFRFLATMICLFWGAITSSLANTYIDKENNKGCNEPAPTNYHITDIFTNEIRVAWDVPPSTPFEYNIKVFETVSGNLIQSFNIPGISTIARAVNLQPGVQYTIRNTPVCPDGTLSDDNVESTGTTLIVEVVVSGFTISGSSTCSFNAVNQYCEADPYVENVTIFRIRQMVSPYASRFFGLYRVSAECEYSIFKIRPEDSNSALQFFSMHQGTPTCPGDMLLIKNGANEVATLRVQEPATTLKRLVCVSMSDNYRIDRFESSTGVSDTIPINCGCQEQNRPGKSKGRHYDSWIDIPPNPTLSATPNPFTNQLDIQIPFANTNENTELNLYDLQGRRVMALRSPGDQQTITLNTEKLSPGMYFLRAESGGMVQTVKVVKTE